MINNKLQVLLIVIFIATYAYALTDILHIYDKADLNHVSRNLITSYWTEFEEQNAIIDVHYNELEKITRSRFDELFPDVAFDESHQYDKFYGNLLRNLKNSLQLKKKQPKTKWYNRLVSLVKTSNKRINKIIDWYVNENDDTFITAFEFGSYTSNSDYMWNLLESARLEIKQSLDIDQNPTFGSWCQKYELINIRVLRFNIDNSHNTIRDLWYIPCEFGI